jgi:hypothetical protein
MSKHASKTCSTLQQALVIIREEISFTSVIIAWSWKERDSRGYPASCFFKAESSIQPAAPDKPQDRQQGVLR